MKKLFLLLMSSISIIACSSDSKEKKIDKAKDEYQQTKESLGEKEKKNPARFISIENRDRKNLIGQTVVIAHITNNATVCTYKNIEIKLSFFSKTGVKLDEGIETVYETISPGETIKFKTKYFTPKGTDSVSIEVLKADGEINAN